MTEEKKNQQDGGCCSTQTKSCGCCCGAKKIIVKVIFTAIIFALGFWFGQMKTCDGHKFCPMSQVQQVQK